MTTLRRERIQKFIEIIQKSELYDECLLHWQEKYLDDITESLAESLADASISRSEQEVKDPIVLGIEAAILSGRPLIESDIQPARNEHNALIAFESAFGVTHGNIGWHGVKKEWTRLRKFLTDLHLKDSDCFKKYRAWYDSTGKFKKAYGVMDLKRDPDGFALSWDMFMSEVGNPDTVENREDKGNGFYI
jgi:hypothetical protein